MQIIRRPTVPWIMARSRGLVFRDVEMTIPLRNRPLSSLGYLFITRSGRSVSPQLPEIRAAGTTPGIVIFDKDVPECADLRGPIR